MHSDPPAAPTRRFFHATRQRNLAPIRQQGLRPNCSDQLLFLFPSFELADMWRDDNESDEEPWVVLAVDHDGPVGTDPFMGVAFVTPETIPVAQLSLVDAAGGTRPLRS